MLNYLNNHFIQSAPFKIFWAGFQSDTLTLQNNGWSIAVEDCHHFVLSRHEVRFILHHELLDLYAYTYINSFEFTDLTDYLMRNKDHLIFNIQVIAKDIITTSAPRFDIDSIKEIDCHPEMVLINPTKIRELSIFKTIVNPESAIIIEPDKVGAILQQIVDAQAPNQKEIRERIKRKNDKEILKQTIHAQILTVA